MGKYIVELKKNETLYKAATRESDGTAYVCSAIGTPYTAPDLEQVRKEAYKDGYDAGFGRKIDASYQEGLSDAWEAVKKLARMDTDTSESITGYFGLHNIMHNLTASEAIEKIRQYEQAQNTSSELTKAINDFLDNTGYALANVAEVLRKMGENNG